MINKNPLHTLMNGSTLEAKFTVLIEEAELTGTVSKSWAGCCGEAVLGMFKQKGLERLPAEIYANAMANLTPLP